jgi:ferredoxin
MIVAEQKPIEQLMAMIEPYEKVLVAGCATCVTVCSTGGEKEVGILASALRLACAARGWNKTFGEVTLTRQCDPEFIEPIKDLAAQHHAVVSLACGVGINFMAERLPVMPVFPGVNTTFIGANPELGVWEERCALCGECILDKTGGICPIARCAKTILNGPCGGSNKGKCEISPDTPCGWQLIVDRMKALGMLDKLTEVIPPKNWSKSRDGGPRKMIREDLKI